jgi:Ino eighty subunit 1
MTGREGHLRPDAEASRSPGSTIDDPEMEGVAVNATSAFWSSPARPTVPDPRTSLQHVPANNTVSSSTTSTRAPNQTPNLATATWFSVKKQDMTEDDAESTVHEGHSKVKGEDSRSLPLTTPPTTSKSKKQSNSQSIYSGNKVRHLKKDDGVPLWRKDIQYEFLRSVFEDDTKCFTNIYTSERNQSFADIYVEAMARSSKTSKILRDKLLSDRPAALNMAMVCLLVNIGRMNTTLNCESNAPHP